jgi:hypothetical protein
VVQNVLKQLVYHLSRFSLSQNTKHQSQSKSAELQKFSELNNKNSKKIVTDIFERTHKCSYIPKSTLGMLREFLGLWQHKKKVWSPQSPQDDNFKGNNS